MKRCLLAVLILSFFGCATSSPVTSPGAADKALGATPSPAGEPVAVVAPVDTPGAALPAGPEPEVVTVPTGRVFAKTVFEGVVKTSYVQLTIVDQADPEKVYQLIIGDKARQKNFPWKIQTVSPGYFFIDLPGGAYRISSIAIPVGTTMAVEPMDIVFEVRVNQTVYLGTLLINGEKERIKLGGVPIIKPGFEYTVQVLDQRAEAAQELQTRLPGTADPFVAELMRANLNNNHNLPAGNP